MGYLINNVVINANLVVNKNTSNNILVAKIATKVINS